MPLEQIVDSIKHPAVKAARLLNQPSGRAASKQYLIEGADMVHLALQSHARLVGVFLTDNFVDASSVLPQLQEREVPIYRVGRGLLFKIIGTSYETAINAVAVVEQNLIDEEQLPTDDLIVVGENLQDPRNVGMFIRTADAAGARALILSRDAADPFSRSAVRSTTGSILRLPIHLTPSVLEVLRRLRGRGVKIVSTSAHAPTTFWDADLSGACAIVFGNETSGVSPAVQQLADLNVTIPMLGGTHSLNVAVAAGIVLYERLRQRRGSWSS
ncbi:MAG: RNA methyltransferase [Abditibacteriales bacterium]|nr:RNA methyltransferase [Abditibacteriales bacterium]MDW8365929.1 RNA methyltransferase [Abditibacteriales bacterium]